jgi:hypothetical protein
LSFSNFVKAQSDTSKPIFSSCASANSKKYSENAAELATVIVFLANNSVGFDVAQGSQRSIKDILEYRSAEAKLANYVRIRDVLLNSQNPIDLSMRRHLLERFEHVNRSRTTKINCLYLEFELFSAGGIQLLTQTENLRGPPIAGSPGGCTKRVNPIFPVSASTLEEDVLITVVLQFLESGTVGDVRIKSGATHRSDLQNAVLVAARQFICDPGIRLEQEFSFIAPTLSLRSFVNFSKDQKFLSDENNFKKYCESQISLKLQMPRQPNVVSLVNSSDVFGKWLTLLEPDWSRMSAFGRSTPSIVKIQCKTEADGTTILF